MKIVVLDAATLGADIDLSPLCECGEVTVYGDTQPSLISERLTDADVAVLNKLKLGEHNLASAKSLKLICVTATGYDNIDTEYCKKRGIALYNVPAYSTDSVAQITLTMALSLICHGEEYRRYVGSGEYGMSGVANKLTPVYHELSYLTWGVVGGGSIGSKVAELASAFGCKILMCRRKTDERYENCDIDDLCRRSDIISLHVPLTDSTRGLINEERIRSMKKGAIIVNVARGAVMDEEAAAKAILDGHLGGLGVDVFTKEPFDESHPFSTIAHRPDVFLTPHMAWGSFESRARCIAAVCENIESFKHGNEKNRIV